MRRVLLTGKRWTAIFCLAISVTTPLAIAENLYHPGNYHSLVADRKAYNVGDVLTVQIIENASATATAGTKTDTSSGVGVTGNSPNKQNRYAVSLDDNFDGSGKIARTGRLLAQVSVVVSGIEPNGDLRVKGEQFIEINGEKQMINLEGIVRPVDIGDGNTVTSNRIANARITYVGDGVLADGQTKNWLSRLFSAFLKIF